MQYYVYHGSAAENNIQVTHLYLQEILEYNASEQGLETQLVGALPEYRQLNRQLQDSVTSTRQGKPEDM